VEKVKPAVVTVDENSDTEIKKVEEKPVDDSGKKKIDEGKN